MRSCGTAPTRQEWRSESPTRPRPKPNTDPRSSKPCSTPSTPANYGKRSSTPSKTATTPPSPSRTGSPERTRNERVRPMSRPRTLRTARRTLANPKGPDMTRTITTVEELDALPTRSVVLDKHGRAWQIRHRWVCNDTKVNPIYLPTDFGTVTLLHAPGKEPRLPGPGDGCQCTGYSQDAGGGYFEHIDEYEPACPEHSEHVYNPRTGTWEHTPRPLPDREQIARAIAPALSNAMNHPSPNAVLGRSVARLNEKVTDAVLTLLEGEPT